MIFAILAVAASAASLAVAQGVSFTDTSLTQCKTSTLNFGGSGGPYYVAVVPAADACTSDALAEFHDVSGPSVDYFVNLPEGTQVQVYVADNSGNEHWSAIMTVAAGDSSCLGGSSTPNYTPADSSNNTPIDSSINTPAANSVQSADPTTSVTSTSTSTSTSATTTHSAYVAPVNAATTTARSSNTNNVASGSDSSVNTPANASGNGASGTTVNFALIGGALFAAAAALF